MLPHIAALFLLVPQAGGESRRAVVGQATHAVQLGGPSTPDWRQRLAADSSDPAALLGLATIARLTYRYDEALSLYARLRRHPPGDSWTAYALLGAADAARTHGSLADAAGLFAQASDDAARAGDRAARAAALLGVATVHASTVPLDSALVVLDAVSRSSSCRR